MELLARHLIRVFNSGSYCPQTNGAVEVANKIAKLRLWALQTEFGTGVRDWVYWLPDIALTLNTSRPKRFPARMTPYLVFFGRQLHWLEPLEEDDTAPFLDYPALLHPTAAANGSPSASPLPRHHVAATVESDEDEWLILTTQSHLQAATAQVKKSQT